MTGKKNILSYISQDKKTNYDSILEYLQKNTKVFNQKGLIEEDELQQMKERAKQNKGNIWHGFISLNEENSHKIDTLEKSIVLVNQTFFTFFQSAKLNSKNIDLICSLHTDRPHHLHIHFVFWEKEPTYQEKDGTLTYRKKGKIDKKALDKMFVKTGIFVSENRDDLSRKRQEAIKALREMTAIKVAMKSKDEIKKAILSLAKELPKTGRVSYGSQDMKPYRERVDQIVKMLLDYNGKARVANRQFYEELEKRKKVIENIMNQTFAYSERNLDEERIKEYLPLYHFNIDKKNIDIIEKIEKDYQRRQGNLVLQLAKFIKPEFYERKKNYTVNHIGLKKSIRISEKKINQMFNLFMLSFGEESELLQKQYTNRLQEIEEEIKQEKKKEEEKSKR